jgi:hypothetical protein
MPGEAIQIQRKEESNETISTIDRFPSNGLFYYTVADQTRRTSVTDAAMWPFRCVSTVGARP